MYRNGKYIQLKFIYMLHSPNVTWRMGSRPYHGKGRSKVWSGLKNLGNKIELVVHPDGIWP